MVSESLLLPGINMYLLLLLYLRVPKSDGFLSLVRPLLRLGTEFGSIEKGHPSSNDLLHANKGKTKKKRLILNAPYRRAIETHTAQATKCLRWAPSAHNGSIYCSSSAFGTYM
jgi:hypothetical protein